MKSGHCFIRRFIRRRGSLSAVTAALQFAGNSIRLGTTVMRIGDEPWQHAAYGLAASLTAALLAQFALLPAVCAAAS
jgi:hypothetical protein